MKIFDTLDLVSPPAGTVQGNHGIWLPAQGIKVPFQWGGLCTKRTRREPGASRDTINDEVSILRALAALGMAPPIGDVVFFRTVISTYPGVWYADALGAYGYGMADATRLPRGRFDIEAMRKLPIEGSPGAWGDVAKPENIVNGYLVDVRRTGWDMLRWVGPDRAELQAPQNQELVVRVHRDCQFPPGEREQAYQDFWLNGKRERGQRRVIERAQALGFDPQPGDRVVDIGCQSGSFLQYAALQTGNQGVFIGVEANAHYVACARALAGSCNQPICIRHGAVTQSSAALIDWIHTLASPIDHLLLLSMEKHLGDATLFHLIDVLAARRTYIETNAVAKDSGEGPAPGGPMKLWDGVRARGGKHVGDSRDRNLRRLYVIDRGAR